MKKVIWKCLAAAIVGSMITWSVLLSQQNKPAPVCVDYFAMRRHVQNVCGTLELKLFLLLKDSHISTAQSRLVEMGSLIMLCTNGAVMLGSEDVDTYPSLEVLHARIRLVQSKMVQW